MQRTDPTRPPRGELTPRGRVDGIQAGQAFSLRSSEFEVRFAWGRVSICLTVEASTSYRRGAEGFVVSGRVGSSTWKCEAPPHPRKRTAGWLPQTLSLLVWSFQQRWRPV